MSEELQAKARKAALASAYVNHPGAAYRVMRELAEHSLDLCDHLEASEARREEMERFMRKMPSHDAFAALNVLEVYQSWRDSGMLERREEA